MAMTVDECRTLLGTLADGKTDAQVEILRDELTVVANQMFDHLQSKVRVEREATADAAIDLPGLSATTEDQLKRDALERVRWIAYAHENGIDDEGAQ
jgi:hypothetical protein